jgi:hypothetical protein
MMKKDKQGRDRRSARSASPNVESSVTLVPSAQDSPKALECGVKSPLSHPEKLMEKDQAAAFNKLTANDWTTDDWADLKFAMDWVTIQVAMRHGILCPSHPCPIHPTLGISKLTKSFPSC